MKLILVDDHELFSMSLKTVLEQYDNIEKVITLKDSSNLLGILACENITLVMLDIHLKDESGLEIGKDLKKKYPEMPLIFLTGFDLMDYKYQAYEIGAEAFIDKGIPPEELYQTINDVINNPSVMRDKIKPKKPPFTEREVELLKLLSKGKKHNEIADNLGISRRTVDALLQRIYIKMDVDNATGAVVQGINMGLIKMEKL